MSTVTADKTYANLINLLAVYSEGKAQLAAMESENNREYLELVDARKDDYAKLQLATTEAEGAIIAIASEHPEWFPERQRTLKTPYGQVHAQKTTRHEAPDPAETISLVEAAIATARHFGLLENVALLEPVVRIEKTLDLDAVARLSDELVAELGIERKVEDSITVKEAKVSLGNAVKAAQRKEAKAGKGEK